MSTELDLVLERVILLVNSRFLLMFHETKKMTKTIQIYSEVMIGSELFSIILI